MNFVDFVRHALITKPELHIVKDQYGSPTSVQILCIRLMTLLEVRNLPPVINSSDYTPKPISRFELALVIRKILSSCEDKLGKIIPISTSELNVNSLKAKRPTNSCLASSDEYVYWENALRKYLLGE